MVSMTAEKSDGYWMYDSDSHYGPFPAGHDPRAFAPDPQMNTREEMAAHARAAEGWDRGDRVRYRKGAFGIGAVFERPPVWCPEPFPF